jgi:hypothetical protein
MAVSDDERYKQTVSTCRTIHGELITLESEGKISNARENPALIGDYLTRLRLHANLLYSFMNGYLDVLNEALRGTAKKRQDLYEKQVEAGKSSNAAETHARETTRVDEANIKIIENTIQQIKNEYERYNGICISLQSRMKEFDTERRMG